MSFKGKVKDIVEGNKKKKMPVLKKIPGEVRTFKPKTLDHIKKVKAQVAAEEEAKKKELLLAQKEAEEERKKQEKILAENFIKYINIFMKQEQGRCCWDL